jgi:hypothetical protein
LTIRGLLGTRRTRWTRWALASRSRSRRSDRAREYPGRYPGAPSGCLRAPCPQGPARTSDAHADVAFSFTFSQSENGTQTGTAYYLTGIEARQPEPVGQVLIADTPVGFDAAAQPVQAGRVRLFMGVRSDPFFADAEGALHGFQWTGQDTFAGKNILTIALEVPDDMLGGPEIGVWATISLRRDGTLVQMDRGGHPTINPFVNPDGEKNEYNARQPADDVANYLEPAEVGELGQQVR